MSQANAVVQASKNDGPGQQAIAALPADALFASQHTCIVRESDASFCASRPSLALITSTPVSTASSAIAGTGTVGQTLRVTCVGSWVGGGSIRYKRQRDGVDILLARQRTPTFSLPPTALTASAAVVTSTNQYGPTSANSNAIADDLDGISGRSTHWLVELESLQFCADMALGWVRHPNGSDIDALDAVWHGDV